MATAVRRDSLTSEQSLALESREISVVLSAGAGCGKTFVLTERFLSHLERRRGASPPSELGNLVAITFTDAAAREMRDRIRRKCHERLIEGSDEEAERWLSLLRRLDGARVSTIHSFCAALIRGHAVEAGLDPRFAIVEPAQSQTLQSELIDDVLRKRLAARDPDALDLVVRLAGGGIGTLRTMIRDLLGERHRIDFDSELAVSIDERLVQWERFHARFARPAALKQVVSSADARTLARIASRHRPSHDKMIVRCELLAGFLPQLAELPRNVDADSFLDDVRGAATVVGLGRSKGWHDVAIHERFQRAAEGFREDLKKLPRMLTFDPAAARESAELGQKLLALVQHVAGAYAARKRELALLDFDDLLAHARDLLMSPRHADLRARLSSQIHLLLVDEFQDTDSLQSDLVRALCGAAEGKLFVVGDVKQSIYRFRGADPGVFRRLQQEVKPAGRLPLTRNFRSQPAVLDFVNALFCDDLGPHYEPLVADRPQVAPQPAVEFLWACPDRDESGKAPKENREPLIRREADWLACRIRQLLDAAEPLVYVPSATSGGRPTARPVRPGDIAILFRALGSVRHYEEALRRHGIDYYLVGGHAFYAQQEIYDLLSLLQAVASPADEVALAGVLRSPVFSLSDEALFWLGRSPGGLNAGLMAASSPAASLPVELDEPMRRRAAFAAATLSSLRARKDRLSVAELIGESLTLTGYDAALLGEFLGERKLANLNKLIDQARSFDRAGIFSLSDFIAQLAEFVATDPKEPLAATISEDDTVVRLMTIHQSKGLEFPVVIVPDLNRPSEHRQPAASWHPELGTVVRPMGERSDTAPLTGFDLRSAVERIEDEAELQRLLYVATTRAADRLILSGGLNDLDRPSGFWLQMLASRFDLRSGELSVTLPSGYSSPHVRVILERPKASAAPNARTRRTDVAASVAARLAQPDAAELMLPRLIRPVPVDRSARLAFSFSQLRGEPVALDERDELPSKPDEPRLRGASDPLALGTLVHAVLEEIDFRSPAAGLKDLLERHVPNHVPWGGEDVDTARTLLERFVASPRAVELGRAVELRREVEYLLAWPSDSPLGRGRYLEGFIDCLYLDAAGAWRIVDFKTNQVTDESLAATAAGYELQMLLYGLAAERALGARPASATLHFLRTGREHEFQLDGRLVARVAALVDQALELSQLSAHDELGVRNAR